MANRRIVRCVQSVEENMIVVRAEIVEPATSGNIEPIHPDVLSTTSESKPTEGITPPSVKSGLTDGEAAQDETYRTSLQSFDTKSTTSKRRYRQPSTALQLAAQANAVATGLLNGTIDLETARAYGTIARTAAQALGVEVQAGRFLKTAPMLSMDIHTVWEDDKSLDK